MPEGEPKKKRTLKRGSEVLAAKEESEKKSSPTAPKPASPKAVVTGPKAMVQPSASAYFAPKTTSNASSSASNLNVKKAPVVVDMSAFAGKKFFRSDKKLVSSTVDSNAPPPKKPKVEPVVDVSDNDIIIQSEKKPTASSSTHAPVIMSAASIVSAAKSPAKHIEVIDDDIIDITMDIDEPPLIVKPSLPVKEEIKTETPKPSLNKVEPLSSPAATKKAKVEIKEDTEASAKKEAGFQKFINRSGPAAPGSKPVPVGQPNCLAGLTFVFTGEMDSTSREEATDLVKRYGGRVTTAASSKTSYVVIGNDAGESKLKKVRDLKIATLDEDSFFELIKSKPPKDQAAPAASPVAKAKSARKATKAAVAKTNSASSVANASSSQEPIQDKGKGPAVAQTDITSLWTVKWAPSSKKDIIGNKSNVENLVKWLLGWTQASKAGFKGTNAKDVAGFKAALVSGPPGIGKTTAAHIVAKECGYDVMELNASDARNKSSLDNSIKSLITNHTMTEYFGTNKSELGSARNTNHCIIMDEVDGMGGGDRGGMAELIALMKKSKVPIICICNDRSSPKVRSLANHCLDLRFSRPTAMQLRSRIMSIAYKEGIKIEPNAIDQLHASTHADIRQILNLLQTWKLKNAPMTFDKSKELMETSQKNTDVGIFDLASKMFFNQTMSVEDKISELYFSDYSLLPPFVAENYIRILPNRKQSDAMLSDRAWDVKQLEYISAAADSIADGDLVDSMIFGRQMFGLMPTHAVFSCILPSYYISGRMTERMAFPSVLGQISKANKGWRLLKELHLHLRLHISGDKSEVRQSYLPALVPRMTQPLITSGVEAVPDVIKFMDTYTITKDDFDGALEIGVAHLNGDSIMKKIPSSVKSAFTRMYNKASHMNPYSSSNLGGKKVAEKAVSVDNEEALEGDDGEDGSEGADEDDDDVKADKNVKAKAPPKARAPAKSRAGSSASSTRGKKRGGKS